MTIFILLLAIFSVVLCCACLNQAAIADEYAERQYEEMLRMRQEREKP